MQYVHFRYPQFVHTSIQAYRTPDSQLVKLFCCGFYEEIMVVEPFSLEVLFRLSSRLNSDWISAFHVIRPRNRQECFHMSSLLHLGVRFEGFD